MQGRNQTLDQTDRQTQTYRRWTASMTRTITDSEADIQNLQQIDTKGHALEGAAHPIVSRR
jgi:hypothetical protein